VGPVSAENVAVVCGLYEAYNRGDIHAVWALMDPCITWTEPAVARLPYVGTHYGPEAVARNVFRHEANVWGDFRAVASTFLYTDDSVVVLGYFHGRDRTSGKPLYCPFVHDCVLRDGRLTRMQSYPDTARVLQEFGPWSWTG
jgi:ketosteroid isomerase-like protein